MRPKKFEFTEIDSSHWTIQGKPDQEYWIRNYKLLSDGEKFLIGKTIFIVEDNPRLVSCEIIARMIHNVHCKDWMIESDDLESYTLLRSLEVNDDALFGIYKYTA